MKTLSVLLVILCSTFAEDTQKPAQEAERARVIEVSRRFISTGTSESGTVDRRTGVYSGSSEETGYWISEYALRLPRSILVIHYDARPTALWGFQDMSLFRKAKELNVRVGDEVGLIRAPQKDQLLVGGKAFSVKTVKETLVSDLLPNRLSPAGIDSSLNRDALRLEFTKSPVLFLQKRLRALTAADVEAIAGPPLSLRTLYDQEKTAVADIVAFADPTGVNDQIEGRFDEATKKLVGLILYPRSMTWADCQRDWGNNVDIVERSEGRRFYEYRDQRLLVLTDRTGKVLNFTLY